MMMKNVKTQTCLATLAMLILLGTAAWAAPAVDNLAGKISGSRYTNGFFQMSFSPSEKGWILNSPASTSKMVLKIQKDQLKVLEKKRASMDTSDTKAVAKLDKQIKDLKDNIGKSETLQNSLNDQNRLLFEAVKVSGGSALVISARCQKMQPGTPMTDGKSYLSYLAAPMGKNAPRYPIKTTQLGGKLFHYVQVPLGAGGSDKLKNSVSRTYCRVVKGYFLIVKCTYPAGGEDQAKKALTYLHF